MTKVRNHADWFDMRIKHYSSKFRSEFRFFISALWQDPLETISALSRLIGEVQEDIRLSKDVWNKVFVR